MSTAPLVPCDGCRRHVRATESACPFCGTSIGADAAEGVVPEPGQRLSRAGVLAFAAAFLSTACQAQPGPTPAPSPPAVDSGMMQTIYGGPPPVPPSPPMPADLAVPAYGGPPPVPPPPPKPPTVRPPMPARPDPGSMSTRYGAPPRPDDGE